MKPIYTFDTETDPFKYMHVPQVFACGLYDGESFHSTWGKNALERMREYIASLPSGIIYAHNGGRFDFFYTLPWFDGKMSIINSRIIKAYGLGHEWRDSYAIYPDALKTYKKDDIDYDKLSKRNRNKHRGEIIEYLESDCVYLHELVTKFWNEFGDNLTIGATAMKEIKKLHKFDTLTAEEDSAIRNRFYYGGRVQCFEKGILTSTQGEKFHVYDINQSYPTSMRNFVHPLGSPKFHCNGITDETFFLTVSGESNGCFPVRDNAGGLCFPKGYGTFHISIYEFRAALDTGQFKPHIVLESVDFEKSGNFAEFVDLYHGLRKQAQLNGEELMSKFYKRVGNSGYGKFAQCPDNYFDYLIKPIGEMVNGYELDYIMNNMCLWKKASEDVTRYNVATGASITGCSRSFLIRAIATANRPLYCDTDSLICESIGSDTECDKYKLGAWKVENSGDYLAIAGRKLYALFDGDECVKYACKGVRLTPQQIRSVASGGRVTWKKDAPTFSLNRGTKFIHRDIKMN